ALFAHHMKPLVPPHVVRAAFPPQLFPCPELIRIVVCGCGRPPLVLVADSMSGRKDFPIGGQGPRISHRSVPGTGGGDIFLSCRASSIALRSEALSLNSLRPESYQLLKNLLQSTPA